MKKPVVTRKCRSHRIGINVFCGLMVAVVTICVLYLRTLAGVLLYVPILLITVPMTLYYSTWQIRFEKQEVVQKVFFRETKRYSYAQLREVVKSFYTSERYFCIRMYFTDGKKIAFRLDDENAAQAEAELQKHCSIKIISY